MAGDRAYTAEESARYRILVEAITDYAIYMLDPTGIVSSWNAGAERFKGYKPDEIIGQHFSRFYTEEDRATGLPARALEISAREGKFEAEGWRLRKDGTRFWAHVVIDPIRDPAGELTGFAKVTRDLTERRASEEALRSSEQQFRLLVQGVTDYAIYMLNPEGTVTNWNPGARASRATARPKSSASISPLLHAGGPRSGMPQRALETAVREGKFEAEGWRMRKDGSRFWSHVIIDPIRDSQGAILGFAKITRDVTERKAAQETLGSAGQAMSMKDFYGRWKFRNDIMNHHVGCNRFRHVAYPREQR